MSRPRSTSTTQLHDLKEWIRSNSIWAYEIPRHDEAGASHLFVPTGTIERHFQGNSCQTVRDLLYAIFELEGIEYANRIRSSHTSTVALHCCRIFCILVLLEQPRLILDFISNPDFWDDRLPFRADIEPKGFPSIPDDTQFYGKFVQEQWRFCARTLKRVSNVKFDGDRILPFTLLEKAGVGNSSVVYRTRVHKEHNKLSEQAQEGSCYAIKSFRSPHAEAAYQRESYAFGLLTRPGAVNKAGLIEYFGGFEYKGTFNIILEYADGGNLEQYLQGKEQPRSLSDAIDFWSSLFQLLKGLARIHKHYYDSGDAENGISQHGWHQDLKPANILVVQSEHSHYRWSFKVADLGLSHFQSMVDAHLEPTDRNRYGTRTYGAPETYTHTSSPGSPKNGLKKGIDIWSLGAIYSEAAVWAVMGSDGLRDYRCQRQAATSSLPDFHVDDCFHDGKRRLAVVDKQHDHVLGEHDRNSSDESLIRRAARQIWEVLIQNMMDARPSHRHPALVLSEKSDEVLDRIQNLARPLGHVSQSSQSTSSPSRNSRYASDHHRIDSGSPTPMFTDMAPMYSSPKSTVYLPNGSYPNEWPRSPSAEFSRRSQPETPLAGPSSPRSYGRNVELSQRSQPQTPHAGPTSSRSHDHNDLYPPTHVAPSGPADQPDLQTTQDHEELMRVLCAQPSGIENPPSTGGATTLSRATSAHAVEPRTETNLSRQIIPSSGSDQVGRLIVPYLSVQELQDWYTRVKAGDKSAKLSKYEYLSNDLRDRDYVFMIDDSEGMRPYLTALKQLVLLLVYVTKKMDRDGVELYFLSSDKVHKVKSSTEAVDLLNTNLTFKSQCSIEGRLGDEIHKYCRHIDRYLKQHKKKPLVKRSIYILTDGALHHGDGVQGHDIIKNLVSKVLLAGMHRMQIGIQFIRFGNDQQGIDRLDRLDHLGQSASLGLDIVDTEPADGNVWKMFHGATNARFDGDS
ncbi:hypothetical protein LTR56_009044 [Elasticomyces elasticus]|nr:hypothetical protein LTR56_009044 [Elasticomyces elasticus]KAK3663845.1 hypothetical protein LTR22_005306 [Elasticomyces elasticus]KAK4923946.1 hypothetical protein LTR49_008891 [Elasticomyces elasticus]KAK5762177.1 hypothetical protein LTS12_007698 [Elasticomyces elasticus]